MNCWEDWTRNPKWENCETHREKGFCWKKKEIEVTNLEEKYRGKDINYQSYQTPTLQITNINFTKPSIPNQSYQKKFPINNQNSYRKRDNQQPEEQLQPLPITLKELFAKLLSIGQITPQPIPFMQSPFPFCCNPKLTCEYHVGNVGHRIETCVAFNKRVF